MRRGEHYGRGSSSLVVFIEPNTRPGLTDDLFEGCRWMVREDRVPRLTGHRALADAKNYIERMYGATVFERDKLNGDWIPQDGAAWDPPVLEPGT